MEAKNREQQRLYEKKLKRKMKKSTIPETEVVLGSADEEEEENDEDENMEETSN